AKSAKCKARDCRAMRRTYVRRSGESNCSNAAVGEFLRRHENCIRTSQNSKLKDFSKNTPSMKTMFAFQQFSWLNGC
ncbi:MAG: hypothetical protein SV239_09770, partial [Thermodesulfobacteriota bacterium]|nr:hypothetical protein [Thermodesulfobacteriota bacterium]